jgi:methionyl-tRNA formyltransferase
MMKFKVIRLTLRYNKAVVFAYHTVGVKCLKALIEAGFEIPLVITHADNPDENIWFESVASLCQSNQIPILLDPDLSDPQLQERIAQSQPDYLFSFYFRQMIPTQILQLAKMAALNMHGSLLPKYRGRVPINWAVLHGEQETGATLHIMEIKPDAGDIVSQEVVQIGPDQTAFEVFREVSQAAVIALEKVLPQLLQGQIPRSKNDLSIGSYFGGRKPQDGLIDWQASCHDVYNLYRAVAPPYPGAFTLLGEHQLIVAKARKMLPNSLPSNQALGLGIFEGKIVGCCPDQGGLWIEELRQKESLVSVQDLQKLLNTLTNA